MQFSRLLGGRPFRPIQNMFRADDLGAFYTRPEMAYHRIRWRYLPLGDHRGDYLVDMPGDLQ